MDQENSLKHIFLAVGCLVLLLFMHKDNSISKPNVLGAEESQLFEHVWVGSNLTEENEGESEPISTPSSTLNPTKASIKTPTAKPYSVIASVTPLPTTTMRIQPVPTLANGVCPERTESCVPCTAGQTYCRYVDGTSAGFLGWACQNNNPGNIRYSQARINIITAFGGPAPCGSKGPNASSQYMVFKDYVSGRNALKVYIKAISQGGHSAYNPECLNGDCSLKFFFSKYAPAGDQNDPNSYANNVANKIGVNADTTKLSWIVANKLDAMVDAIQIHGGWFVL